MTYDVHAFPARIERSACQVALNVARAALQQKLIRRVSSGADLLGRRMNMGHVPVGGPPRIRSKLLVVTGDRSIITKHWLHLTASSDQPLGSLWQDGCLNKMLPWREPRRLEMSAAESQRDACSTVDFSTISTKSSMKEAVAELQLEGQLAKVAEHAVARQRLTIASMAD